MADEIDPEKNEKQRVRETVREGRAALAPAERQEASIGITAQLISLVEAREARSVSCYMSVAGEPDTEPFLRWAREHDVDVLLPSVREDGLLDWIRPSWDGTVPGPLGIPEPLGTYLSPIEVGDVDLMLIPACAVDRRGVRLGWGGGYFDKSLGSMDRRPPVFAVVHDAEFVEELPEELHDIRVTGVATPSRIEYLDDGDEEAPDE